MKFISALCVLVSTRMQSVCLFVCPCIFMCVYVDVRVCVCFVSSYCTVCVSFVCLSYVCVCVLYCIMLWCVSVNHFCVRVYRFYRVQLIKMQSKFMQTHSVRMRPIVHIPQRTPNSHEMDWRAAQCDTYTPLRMEDVRLYDLLHGAEFGNLLVVKQVTSGKLNVNACDGVWCVCMWSLLSFDGCLCVRKYAYSRGCVPMCVCVMYWSCFPTLFADQSWFVVCFQYSSAVTWPSIMLHSKGI